MGKITPELERLGERGLRDSPEAGRDGDDPV